MLIPLKEILTKYNLSPKGVIQVGSHWAEEHEEFVSCGINRFVYIEPCKDAYKKIIEKYVPNLIDEDKDRDFLCYGFASSDMAKYSSICFIRYACGNTEGEMPMYVSHQNQGQSNSLLKPNGHLTQHPEIVFDDSELVKVSKLDNLIDKYLFSCTKKEDRVGIYDILCLDCQGYEGEVLKGATETLKNINLIYTEVNSGQTYDGNMEIDEMDTFLAEYSFKRVETYWPSPLWTWGDAIYIRETVLNG